MLACKLFGEGGDLFCAHETLQGIVYKHWWQHNHQLTVHIKHKAGQVITNPRAGSKVLFQDFVGKKGLLFSAKCECLADTLKMKLKED